MPQPMFKTLTGAINGVNLVFSFGQPYTPGTTAIYRNGQLLLNPGGNPWTETDPSTGTVTIHAEELPRAGDAIAGFALDVSTVSPETLIEGMTGVMAADETLSGSFDEEVEIIGWVSEGTLWGSVSDGAIAGVVTAEDSLSGTMEEC